MPGKLYLIPTLISEEAAAESISAPVVKTVGQLRIFFVEEEKTARRFLKKIIPSLPLPECVFYPLNEHTVPQQVKEYFQDIREKEAGIISESGCPCVADPGADIVLLAHKNHMEVIPLAGHSSILLALMASGLNGQNFAFNGYLPKEKDARIKQIKELEKRSLTEGQTQIFMETPYRNQNIFEDLLAACDPGTLLCVAVDLTGAAQDIKTLSIKEWKQANRTIAKKPALFLLGRGK